MFAETLWVLLIMFNYRLLFRPETPQYQSAVMSGVSGGGALIGPPRCRETLFSRVAVRHIVVEMPVNK